MKQYFAFSVAPLWGLLLLFVSGCASPDLTWANVRWYHLTKPIHPVGLYDSLAQPPTPTLEWKPVPDAGGVTYDLVIYIAYRQRDGTYIRGNEAYYRTGLKETRHLVETNLAMKTYYCWSVRTRIDMNVSAWATYDVKTSDFPTEQKLYNQWWTFHTK